MPRENENIIRFWSIFKEPVLSGIKIQSRRRGLRDYSVGMILDAEETETEIKFAKLKVTKVWQQNYLQMTDEEGQKDGFKNKEDFWKTFCEIYSGVTPEEVFTAVEFEVIK
jgi:hypothetical protein